MITVSGNDLFRGGQKVGYIQNNDVFSHDGKKLGYVNDSHIFNQDGQKIAYLEGDYMYHTGDSRKTRIEDNREHVNGGSISDALRGAVRVLLGD